MSQKVLYAEDEEPNRRLMELQLRKCGIACDTAVDGVEALAMFRSNEYAVIILDQYMPGLNGSEVAERIRLIDTHIPLIAITSDDSQVPILDAAGFDRVFLKPLHRQDYINTIIHYL